MTTTRDEYVWIPSSDYLNNARVGRFAQSHGIDDIETLRARSVADIAWYWDAVVSDLGLRFSRPYSRVVDLSNGITDPEWFVGSTINIVDSCLTRWVEDPSTRLAPAIVHESEDGTVEKLTYAELDDRVRRVAAGLRALGLGRGDAIALFMPMTTEAVVSLYAIARIGAVAVPLFSGFAPNAVAARLTDANARAIIVAESTVRRGRRISMLPVARSAVEQMSSIKSIVVVGSPGPNEVSWADLIAGEPESGAAEPMDPSDPFLLGYTSGTTGRPKGAVHTHAGFLVKTASEVAYSFDIDSNGVFFWMTDMGWIMGPLSVIGTHANGAQVLFYEGAPDFPGDRRLWELVERHKVTMLGVSPTLIRTIRGGQAASIASFDLTSVHSIGSTGEPWDPDSYNWLGRDVFGGRVPIINFSGGTEVGGSFLAPYPIEPIGSCSLGGPSLGMDVDVVDSSGHPIRGEIGELVCRQPWPSMTRGIWKDRQRYLDAYWSTFPGIWRHGDHASVDAKGQWFLHGRSDEVINVAGKRLAPAEVEAAILAHPAVAEAAVVSVPHASKGEAVWAFWVVRPDHADELKLDSVNVEEELRQRVVTELGKPFAPSLIRRVDQLPKTRSGKIMRLAVRAAAIGQDPGDLSSAENPAAVELVAEAVGLNDRASTG